MCGFGVQTQNYLEATKSIYPVGCADKAVMWIESHLLLVGALALGLALPQVHTHTLRANWQQFFDTCNPEQLCTEITRSISSIGSHTHTHMHINTGINWRFAQLNVQQSTLTGPALSNTRLLGAFGWICERNTASVRTLHLSWSNTCETHTCKDQLESFPQLLFINSSSYTE